VAPERLSPRDPLAWSDQEAEPRRPLLPPTPGATSRRQAALLVAGIAWGAALAFTRACRSTFGFLVFVLQLGVGLVFIITWCTGSSSAVSTSNRVVIVAALVVGGGALGMAAGPRFLRP